jgi:hypothetical protein
MPVGAPDQRNITWDAWFLRQLQLTDVAGYDRLKNFAQRLETPSETPGLIACVGILEVKVEFEKE